MRRTADATSPRQLLLLASMLLLLVSGCRNRWGETYRYDGEEAFDLLALYELLEARPEGLTHVMDSVGTIVQDTTLEGATYFFVGNTAHYSERSVTHLLDFVERGNTAFIAAYQLPEDLAYHLFGDLCYYNDIFDDYYGANYNSRYQYDYIDSTNLFLSETGDSIQLYHVGYNGVRGQRNVSSLSPLLLCDEYLANEIVGTMDTGLINLVRLPWGEGTFYYTTTPIYYTNFYVVDSVQYRYAEAALTALGPGPVFWDEYSRIAPPVNPPAANNPTNPRTYTGGRNLLQGNEALRYILEQPPLALAWYTLLAAIFLFVLFRGKRRQRIIPLILPRENSSRRFIDTISRLIFQKGNHSALARREVAALRIHLHERFGLRWKEGDPPPEDLAVKIGADPAVVERARAEIGVVANSKGLSEGGLVRFYRAIAPLYQL